MLFYKFALVGYVIAAGISLAQGDVFGTVLCTVMAAFLVYLLILESDIRKAKERRER